MTRRTVFILAGVFGLSVALLALAHCEGDPSWIRQHLSAASGSDGVLWQVQTTFLSVGFAGLAIAAQLFAEAPLAIGASRGRVLEYIKAGWFMGVGLVANVIIGVETVWLSSGLGVLGVALLWFAPTVVLLVVSARRLMQLFGNPSRLDDVVGASLVNTLSARLGDSSRKYADAKKQLESVAVSDWPSGLPRKSPRVLPVPVPEAGRVIKMIRPKAVRRALDSLGLRANGNNLARSDAIEVPQPHHLVIDVEPGDRTRLGETAFRVVTSEPLDDAVARRVIRLLQSSIEFEPIGSVTPYEETDREIDNLKDAIGTSLRTGAFATAERALVLLGHVVRGVWMADPAVFDSTRRASFTRRDWLFRSVGEVEQDVLISPRAAGLFVSAAMTRALEAPRTHSTDYVDDCLRSFTRLWSGVLSFGGPEFDPVRSRITTCIQNLTAYSYSVADDRDDLQARGTWAMVELVKLALDARQVDAAKTAAEELRGLFEYDREGTGRAHVRGGQLVLAGWLDFLAAKNDARDPKDAELRAMVVPRGRLAELFEARKWAESGAAPFSRWDWWETETSLSGRVQTLELSTYIDRALLVALSSSHGVLPPADGEDVASDYKRLLRLLEETSTEPTEAITKLKSRFTTEIAKWDLAEGQRLAQEPLSPRRIEDLEVAIREALADRPRLADVIPVAERAPGGADDSLPILGLNFRVPRHYFVDRVFNHTYADPKELGRIIGQGFVDGEDLKVVGELRKLAGDALPPTGQEIRHQIETLGAQAPHFVLVTPYGGLDDAPEWYSPEFAEILGRVTHIESGVLDDEAFLFDRRATVTLTREPEEKTGLNPVQDTSIAVGVFEDVHGGDEPQVRLESGEYFVVWPSEDPQVVRFCGQSSLEQPDSSEATDTDGQESDSV